MNGIKIQLKPDIYLLLLFLYCHTPNQSKPPLSQINKHQHFLHLLNVRIEQGRTFMDFFLSLSSKSEVYIHKVECVFKQKENSIWFHSELKNPLISKLIPFELIGGTPETQSLFLWNHEKIKRNQPRHQEKNCGPPQVWLIFSCNFQMPEGPMFICSDNNTQV